MAYIATVHLLVDAAADFEVFDGLNEMLRAAQLPVDEANPDEEQFIVDWAIDDPRPVAESLNHAICNKTYEEGDMTSDPAYHGENR